jgi:multidrug resistance protein
MLNSLRTGLRGRPARLRTSFRAGERRPRQSTRAHLISAQYGRRKPFIIGLFLYSVLQGLCAAVNNFGALLFLRFLAGVAGSPPFTNAGATIGDLFPPDQRGIPMSLFSLSPFAGPALGPLVGGFLGPSHLGYKFIFILLCILSAVSCIITYFFLPETYPPALRYQKAKRLRKGGEAHMHSELDLARKNWKSNIGIWLWRPMEMLAKEPILATICLLFVCCPSVAML